MCQMPRWKSLRLRNQWKEKRQRGQQELVQQRERQELQHLGTLPWKALPDRCCGERGHFHWGPLLGRSCGGGSWRLHGHRVTFQLWTTESRGDAQWWRLACSHQYPQSGDGGCVGRCGHCGTHSGNSRYH